MSKKFWESRVFWVNILTFIFYILQHFELVGELSNDWAVFLPAAIALINLILRWRTNQAVCFKL